MHEIVVSPCISVCTLKDGVCIGCHRTLEQIRKWYTLDDNGKKEVLDDIKKRTIE